MNKPETGRISSRPERVHIVKRYSKVGTTMEMEETEREKKTLDMGGVNLLHCIRLAPKI